MTQWSNTETAKPLCKHQIEAALAPRFTNVPGLPPREITFPPPEPFNAMIRAAFAQLYAEDATCDCERK